MRGSVGVGVGVVVGGRCGVAVATSARARGGSAVENQGSAEVCSRVLGIIGHAAHNICVCGKVGRVLDVQGLTDAFSNVPAGASALAERVDAVWNDECMVGEMLKRRGGSGRAETKGSA